MRFRLLIRCVAPLALLTLGACSADEAKSAPDTLNPRFVDFFAPLGGDDYVAAATEIQTSLSTFANRNRVKCLESSGYRGYDWYPQEIMQDSLRGHFDTSIAAHRLEVSGLVSASSPRLSAVPTEVEEAWVKCDGKVGGAAQKLLDDFDGIANPALMRASEMRSRFQDVQQSDDPKYEDYRACFVSAGVPDASARNPIDALNWAIATQNALTTNPSDDQLERWAEGDGVLDADGGKMASAMAHCVRLFEQVNLPFARAQRDKLIDDHADELLALQERYQDIVGSLPGGGAGE